jgi:pyridoxine 4-dehydrogenase
MNIKLGDLTVNRLGFGAMRVLNANVWGPAKEPAAAHRVFRRAVELGINFFDTADSYGPHTDEELIAAALHPYPTGFVVATKGGLVRPRPGAWDPDGRPAHLREACQGSLRRLKLERIDLYQLHAPDPKVPLEDSVGALADLRREGKIRHIGLSNVSVKELDRARKVVPIVSVQNRYNVGDRNSDAVLRHCEKLGIAFLPWYPLGAGSALKLSEVKAVARKRNATASQVILAWLLAKSPVMLPIPGTGSVAHLEENVAAAALKLDSAELAALG